MGTKKKKPQPLNIQARQIIMRETTFILEVSGEKLIELLNRVGTFRDYSIPDEAEVLLTVPTWVEPGETYPICPDTPITITWKVMNQETR